MAPILTIFRLPVRLASPFAPTARQRPEFRNNCILRGRRPQQSAFM